MANPLRLATLNEGAAQLALPASHDLSAWHQALTAALAARLTPAHAGLLAVPVRGEAGITWFAPGIAVRRFTELSADDRERLSRAAGTMLSDIRRLAESGTAPTVAAAWPALRSVPDLGHLFAVDGRPVLSGWGFAPPAGGSGPLASLDDGVAWRPSPRWPWRSYAGALAALAALALFAGLLLPWLALPLMPSPGVCRVAPGQLALLLEAARETDRGNVLRAALSQAEEARGTQALQCPLRVVSPPPSLPPTRERAKVCMGGWPIGKWIRIIATPQNLAPEAITLNADPAVTLPDWSTYTTRFTACGAFRQRRSISSRPHRLPDGRSVMLNSIIADGPDGAQLCYEYWDAYRKEPQGWVRDTVQLVAVVLRTPQGVAADGSPTNYCAPPSQH